MKSTHVSAVAPMSFQACARTRTYGKREDVR